MKKISVIFYIAIVLIMLTGCSYSFDSKDSDGYLVKEVTAEQDTFNRDTYDITYQLTKEQQENFVSAGYDILCSAKGVGCIDDSEDERADELYMYVYGGRNVELDENGVLHAYYGKEALYGYNQTYKEYTYIPLRVVEEKEQVENERRFACSAIVSNYGIVDSVAKWKQETVVMQIVVNEEYPNGIIKSIVSDESQDKVNLNKYSAIEVVNSARYFTRGANGEMIDFFDWEHPGKILGVSMDLTEGCHLEMKPLDNPENYYCIIYMKDVNGNITYSEMIPIIK